MTDTPKPGAEIINLRTARKNRARAGRAAEADANRARHGQTKASASLEDARRDKAARDLDGHRRGREDGEHPDQDGERSDS